MIFCLVNLFNIFFLYLLGLFSLPANVNKFVVFLGSIIVRFTINCFVTLFFFFVFFFFKYGSHMPNFFLNA